MQSRYTVYRVTCNDGKVCHFDLSVMNDRHFVFFILISRIFLFYFQKESAVDLLNDLINTRKQTVRRFQSAIFPSASAMMVWLVYAQVFVVISHASSQVRPSSSRRILISSATATVGCVSFIWNGYFLRKFVDIRDDIFYNGLWHAVHWQIRRNTAVSNAAPLPWIWLSFG